MPPIKTKCDVGWDCETCLANDCAFAQISLQTFCLSDFQSLRGDGFFAEGKDAECPAKMTLFEQDHLLDGFILGLEVIFSVAIMGGLVLLGRKGEAVRHAITLVSSTLHYYLAKTAANITRAAQSAANVEAMASQMGRECPGGRRGGRGSRSSSSSYQRKRRPGTIYRYTRVPATTLSSQQQQQQQIQHQQEQQQQEQQNQQQQKPAATSFRRNLFAIPPPPLRPGSYNHLLDSDSTATYLPSNTTVSSWLNSPQSLPPPPSVSSASTPSSTQTLCEFKTPEPPTATTSSAQPTLSTPVPSQSTSNSSQPPPPPLKPQPRPSIPSLPPPPPPPQPSSSQNIPTPPVPPRPKALLKSSTSSSQTSLRRSSRLQAKIWKP